MSNGTARDFKTAVTDYTFPGSEPIFCMTFDRADCELALFRGGGGEQVQPHRTLVEFWASALFNYLEDNGCDELFEQFGESGSYDPLTNHDATRVLNDLLGEISSEYIVIPRAPSECYRAHNATTLKSLVGVDDAGFFAVFWELRV